MNNGSVLLDTNILIDLVGGHRFAYMELSRHDGYAISRINWIEVLSGGAPGQEQVLLEVLSRVSVLEISTEVAAETVRLRRTTKLKLPDAIIYATALVHGMLFLTRNTRDFNETMPHVRIPYAD